jgi:tetratricopeptide (TPR) repeat protein/Sec-independent protein translocase protein TatA
VLKAVEPFTSLLIILIIAIVLFMFRKEVPKLVEWVVSFRRIAKTKDGFSFEGSSAPELTPALSEQKEQAAVIAEIVTETLTSPLTTVPIPSPKLRWVDALIEKRYDDATGLLEKELEVATDADHRLVIKGAIGNVKFEENAGAGVEYFENLILQHPKKPEPYRWYALSFLWKDLPSKAEVILRQGLQAVDRKALLYDTLSDCLTRLGRVSEALQAAADGVAEDPVFVPNYLNAARISTSTGEKDTARRWYLRALDASNGAEYILDAYARFLSDTDRKAETILRFQELASRNSNNASYFGLLGNAYLAEGFNSLALACYLRAHELTEGKVAWVEANIGNIFNNQGFYGEAIKYLKAAVTLDSDFQYAHERLAQAQKFDIDERERLTAILKDARVNEAPQLVAAVPVT